MISIFKKLLLLSFLFLFLISCNNKSENDGKIVLEYWVISEETLLDEFKSALRDFEKIHKDTVKIEVKRFPIQSFFRKQILTNQMDMNPDFALTAYSNIGPLIAGNGLYDLTDFIEEDSIKMEEVFVKAPLEDITIKNRYYGIPYEVDAFVLACNKRLLREAGFDTIPESWEDFRAAITKIDLEGVGLGENDKPGSAHGLVFPGLAEGGGNGFYWSMGAFLVQSGYLVTDRDYTVSNMNQPEFRKSIEYMLSLKPGIPEDAFMMDGSTSSNLFKIGKAGFLFTGPWFFSLEGPDCMDEWELAVIPHREGRKGSAGGGWALSVYKGCKHPRLAYECIKYLIMTPEINAKINPVFPAYIPAQNVGKFSTPRYQVFRDNIQYASPGLYYNAIIAPIGRISYKYISGILRGDYTVDEGLEQGHKAVQDYLDKFNKKK